MQAPRESRDSGSVEVVARRDAARGPERRLGDRRGRRDHKHRGPELARQGGAEAAVQDVRALREAIGDAQQPVEEEHAAADESLETVVGRRDRAEAGAAVVEAHDVLLGQALEGN